MKNILVVDDQFGIRIALNEVLQREGYKVYQAANGKQALDILEKQDIDLMLLDIKLPGMDGFEILRRATLSGFSKPVITMSAYGENETYQKAKELGVKIHFPKPFDMDRLIEAIAVVISKDTGISNSTAKAKVDEKWVIHRIFDGVAVIKCNGVVVDFPKELLPKEAKAGDEIEIEVAVVR